MEHKFAIQTVLAFLSTLREHSKWRANKNEIGRRDNAHPNLKIINNEIMKSLITLQKKLCRCAKNQNCGFI